VRGGSTSPCLNGQRRSPRSNSTCLEIGDRLVDESGEWQVLARSYTTACGKTVKVRVQRADNPTVMAIRVWGAYERVSTRRAANTEEGKR